LLTAKYLKNQNLIMTKKLSNRSKWALSLVFATVFTTMTFAQDLRFGLQLSPSWSWITTDNSKINGAGTALGLKLGLVIENRFSEAYSISSGIGFHFNTGGSLRFGLPGQLWKNSWSNFDAIPKAPLDTFAKDAKLRYSITFVEVPIGLKFRTPEAGNHIRWFAEPMLSFGFRSSAKGEISAANPIPEQEKIKISKEVAGIMLSWGIGGGGEYIIQNNTALVVGLYYQHGFTDVTSDDSSVMFDATASGGRRVDNSKGNIRSLTVRLGIMF
jgi:Outer membrane protein beta-barrel domain